MKRISFLLTFLFFQYCFSDSLVYEITGATNDYVNIFICQGEKDTGELIPDYTTSFSIQQEETFSIINLFYLFSDSIEQPKFCGTCNWCVFQTKYGPKFNIGRLPQGTYIIRDGMKNAAILGLIAVEPKPLVNFTPHNPVNEPFYKNKVIDTRDSIRVTLDLGVLYNKQYPPIIKNMSMDGLANTLHYTIDYPDRSDLKSELIRKPVYTHISPPLSEGFHSIYYDGLLLDSFMVYSEEPALDTFAVIPEKVVQGESLKISVLAGMQGYYSPCNSFPHYPNYFFFAQDSIINEPYFSAYSYPIFCAYPAVCTGPPVAPLFSWGSSSYKEAPWAFRHMQLYFDGGRSISPLKEIPAGTYNVYYTSFFVIGSEKIYHKIGEITIHPSSTDIETDSNRDYPFISHCPNPFNPVTYISYNTGKHPTGLIKIFNISGKLVSSTMIRGRGTMEWNARNFSSGIYVLKALIGKKQFNKKLILKK